MKDLAEQDLTFSETLFHLRSALAPMIPKQQSNKTGIIKQIFVNHEGR